MSEHTQAYSNGHSLTRVLQAAVTLQETKIRVDTRDPRRLIHTGPSYLIVLSAVPFRT